MWPRLRGIRGLGLMGGMAVAPPARRLLQAAIASHLRGLVTQVTSNRNNRQAIAGHARALIAHTNSIRASARSIRVSKAALMKNQASLIRGRAAVAIHARGFAAAFAAGKKLGLI